MPEPTFYISTITGYPVSTKILDRFDAGTPLNENEADTFAFAKTNLHFISALEKMVQSDVDRGDVQTIGWYIEELRNDPTVQTDHDEFKLNNNHRPYFARLLNESFGAPIFQLRTVIGEVQFDGDPNTVTAENITFNMFIKLRQAVQNMGSEMLAELVDEFICNPSNIEMVRIEQAARHTSS